MDGGSEITEYLLEMASSEQDERRVLYQGPAAEFGVTNLLPGRTYSFWLRAGNKVGVTTALTTSDWYHTGDSRHGAEGVLQPEWCEPVPLELLDPLP